ncbi:MAG: molecular chaperone TorD family protein [Desulfomonile tiedjei]|nr:molecular chaperone TorD family protein [Desulfomonile tiedjei]
MKPTVSPSFVGAEPGPRADDGFRLEELAPAATELAGLLGNLAPLTVNEAREAAEVLRGICPEEFSIAQLDIEAFARSWNEEKSLLLGPVPPVSLEESVYKSWTDDPSHPLRGATGLAHGDPARHMERILNDFGMALPAESLQSPDHVAVLLLFLAFLLEERSVQDAAAFCQDHLDWMPALTAALTADGRGVVMLKLVNALESLIETIMERMGSEAALHDARNVRS